MPGRKRTDSEEVEELAEELPQHDFGGLGTMIAREIAIEARRARARREFYRIEHVNPTKKGVPETRFLGLYTVTGENGREYSVLVRDPDPNHHVNRCSCLDYELNNLGTCKHIEAVLGYIRRKHKSALSSARPQLLEINRLTVYVTLRYVGDGTWTAAPVYDHALDPGLLRIVNHYLMPYLALAGSTTLTRSSPGWTTSLREVEDFGGKVVVEPEMYDYAETVKNRLTATHAAHTSLAVEAGQARSGPAQPASLPLSGCRHALPGVYRSACWRTTWVWARPSKRLPQPHLAQRVARHQERADRHPCLGQAPVGDARSSDLRATDFVVIGGRSQSAPTSMHRTPFSLSSTTSWCCETSTTYTR